MTGVPTEGERPDPDDGEDQTDPSSARPVTGSDDQQRPARFLDRLRRDMTRNEQLVVYLGAILALGVNLFVAASPATVTHGSKTAPVSVPLVIVIGVVSFIVLGAVARYGRRTVAAIAALLVSFVTAQPLGYAYIALGAWLFYKGTRAQRQRMAAQGGPSSASRGSGAGRSGTRSTGRPSASSRRGRQPEAPQRPASKRYTPPGTKGRRR